MKTVGNILWLILAGIWLAILSTVVPNHDDPQVFAPTR